MGIIQHINHIDESTALLIPNYPLHFGQSTHLKMWVEQANIGQRAVTRMFNILNGEWFAPKYKPYHDITIVYTKPPILLPDQESLINHPQTISFDISQTSAKELYSIATKYILSNKQRTRITEGIQQKLSPDQLIHFNPQTIPWLDNSILTPCYTEVLEEQRQASIDYNKKLFIWQRIHSQNPKDPRQHLAEHNQMYNQTPETMDSRALEYFTNAIAYFDILLDRNAVMSRSPSGTNSDWERAFKQSNERTDSSYASKLPKRKPGRPRLSEAHETFNPNNHQQTNQENHQEFDQQTEPTKKSFRHGKTTLNTEEQAMFEYLSNPDNIEPD